MGGRVLKMDAAPSFALRADGEIMPASSLIADWSHDQKTAFRRSPITFGHGLSETRLFDDEALVRLIDDCPPALRDIRRLDGRVETRPLTGRQVLEGVRQGRLEARLSQVESVSPVLGTLMGKIASEIRRQAPASRAGRPSGQLILSPAQGWSTPNAEGPAAMLFHLRGRTRLWVYPAAGAPRAAKGRMFDLEPGVALALPPRAPHRIESLDDVNVSLSVRTRSWVSRLADGAGRAGALLRRWEQPMAERSTTDAIAAQS